MPSRMPRLPKANSQGNFPALSFARVVLARDIVRERLDAGLTQEELAAKAGVHVQTLCKLETGKSTPSPATVKNLDTALQKISRPPTTSNAVNKTTKSARRNGK
jgi:transcriptional regulator with XRE-family HTH domain